MGTGVGARKGRDLLCRKTPRGLKPKTGFERDRKSRNVPEAFRRKVQSGGRRKVQEDAGRWFCGGSQACDMDPRAAIKLTLHGQAPQRGASSGQQARSLVAIANKRTTFDKEFFKPNDRTERCLSKNHNA
jgi:hypothetical protein